MKADEIAALKKAFHRGRVLDAVDAFGRWKLASAHEYLVRFSEKKRKKSGWVHEPHAPDKKEVADKKNCDRTCPHTKTSRRGKKNRQATRAAV
jgi:hypothetical protein